MDRLSMTSSHYDWAMKKIKIHIKTIFSCANGIYHKCNQLPKMTIPISIKSNYNTAFYPVEYNARFFVRI